MKLSATDLDRVRATAASLVEQRHLPGLAVGIVQGDELTFAEGFGFADIESGRKQDPALRQRIGSITKTMTALCIMALIDEGASRLTTASSSCCPTCHCTGTRTASPCGIC